MKPITQLPQWHALETHYKTLAAFRIQESFAEDGARFHHFSLKTHGLLLDYSKNRIDRETLTLLSDLAIATKLPDKIKQLFEGHPLNSTENQPALHTALRNLSDQPVYVNHEDIMPDIRGTLTKMRNLTEKIRHQEWLGVTGKPIRDIVNIGIGGSHLGTRMASHALQQFSHPHLRCHFISNIDSIHLQEVLNQLHPETTLFIISSKSFTTLETLTNAHTIRDWMRDTLKTTNLAQHFIAITANPEKALAFGIIADNILPIWDWVGGRYSMWSAVGLPLAIMIGMDHFMAFLEGAHAMDNHFRHANFQENMPVILGLLGIWYINFFNAKSHAIVPYTHRLNFLQDHLQQADMESNGKTVTHEGLEIPYATGPIIWGEQGCHGQHAFHQLLHQGQHLIPVDFILVGHDVNAFDKHHDMLIASGLSQAQALMQGKTYEQALNELLANGLSSQEAERLAMHKTIPGNRPSNTLFMDAMTPYHLGALLALYEHKIFVQGAIWNINSFDQWGVELGKQLLPEIYADLTNASADTQQDASTRGLIDYYKMQKESACKNTSSS